MWNVSHHLHLDTPPSYSFRRASAVGRYWSWPQRCPWQQYATATLMIWCGGDPDHFSTSLTIAERGILDLLRFLTVTGWFSRHSAKWLTPTDKTMNPQHFGSDPADIRIRILDHWFRLDALAEVCVLWAQPSWMLDCVRRPYCYRRR